MLRWFDYSISGDLPNAEIIDSAGLFIANHHYPLEQGFAPLCVAIEDALSVAAGR